MMASLSRLLRLSLLPVFCGVVLLGLAPLTAAAQNPGEPDPTGDDIPLLGPGGVGDADSTVSGQPHNVLWLRAEDVDAVNGDPVTTWGDISGNDHDFSQGTSSQQPVFRDGSNGINNKAVVNFDGTNDVLTDSDGNDYITGTDSLTAIYVVESDKTNYDGGLFTTHVPDNHDTNAHTFRYDANGATSGSANTIKFAVTTDKFSDGDGDSDESETSEGVSTPSGTLTLHSTSPRLYTASWRSGEFLDLWVNGYEETDLDRAGKNEGAPGNGDPGLNGRLDEQAGEAVRVGQGAKDGDNDGNAPGGHWEGKIAEVIVYRDKLNSAQRKIVETYLRTRYAFGNVNNDLFGFDSNYGEEVGGIGRDSASAFHLKGGGSIIELDANDASNLNDGDFALLGHDGNSLNYTTSERPNGGSNVQKVQREWKVDLTGSSSQTLSVDVDVSGLSFPSGYNDFAVFVDDDGDFTSGATFYDLNDSGEASGVSIDDGDYITVASIRRTISYTTGASSAFENDGGDDPGDAFSPALQVELNYTSSTSITGIPYTVSEVTGTLVEDTDNTFGNEGPGNQEDYRRTENGTFTIGAGVGTKDFNSGGGALEVLNDTRDASSKSDEETAEDLDVDLDTGSLPSALAAGGTTTQTFTINDDDDFREVSFANGGSGSFKPLAIQSANPEEDNDPNNDNQTGEENAVATVSFEVALPEGVEGSPTTKAVFEVTGADTDDFSIPDGPSDQERVGDRKGKVVINTTKSVDGPDADTDKSDTGYGTFDINITDDALFENDETFTVTLTTAESATLDSDGSADLDLDYTILNDDNVPEVDFELSSNSGDESTTGVTATLRLTDPDDGNDPGASSLQAAGTDLDVDFSVSGTATAGDDYTQNTSSPTTILEGNTTKDISFSVSDDQVQEANESIIVDISYGSSDTDPAEPSSGNKTFTYTILDNDNIGPDGPGGVGDGEALQVWLDASNGVNQTPGGSPSGDGDPVGEWVDQSANTHDFEQSGSSRPSLTTNGLNGRPVVTFNSSNNEVLADGDGGDQYVNGESAFSQITVSQANATGTEAGVFLADNDGGTGSNGDNTVMLRYTGGSDLQFGLNTNESGGSTQTFTSAGNQSTDAQILQLDWDSGNAFDFYLDGTNEDSEGSPLGGGLQNAQNVLIGRSDDGSDAFWDGDIAESIFYTQTLNQAQRRIVENYLSAKYDIGVANDIYAGDTGFGNSNGNDGDPSNGGDYDLAMVGVGQVSGEAHNRARGDGIDVAVKTGLEDGDFATAGHRVPNNSVTSDGVGVLDGTSGDNRRSLRTWAVDWTDANTTLEVDITFSLSSLGFQGLAGDAGNYKLIESSQDSTGAQTYSWSATSASASVTGDKITFTNVTLTDGNYYTLATTDNGASPLTSETALVISGSEGNEGNANSAEYGGDAGWRQLGVPTKDTQAQDIFSGTDDPFVEFILDPAMMFTWDDEVDKGGDPDGNWVRTDKTTPVPNGRGFMIFFFDDEGTADADPIDPDLVLDVPDSKSPPGDVNVDVGDGAPSSDDAFNVDAEYHLLSNPYTVPYDLTSLLDGVSGIQSTVQIWDGSRSSGGPSSYITVTTNSTTGETESVTSGDVIAPWQGFFIQRSSVGSGPTSLTFGKAGRTTGSRSIVGSKAQPQADEGDPTQLKLKLVTRDDRDSLLTQDRAASLYFATDASSGWDTYDASKLFPLTAPGDPWATIAPLGTGSDGATEPKSVESRSKSAGSFEVPLELRTSDELEGTMTITAPTWRNVPEDWSFELVDTTGTSDTVHELKPGGDGYSFSFSASKSTDTKTASGVIPQTDGRASPGLRTAGSDTPMPRKMEVAEKTRTAGTGKATSKDTKISTRFKLRVELGGAIPVEFAGMNATVDDRDVVLNWSTASETNNSGFYVEHKAASDEPFRSVNFVEGAGTTNALQEYRYRINGLDVGEHTFRIRQVDTDGGTSLSKSVTVDVRLDGAFALSKPYPNPFRHTTMLDLTVREKQEVTAEVYDALGRRVQVLHDGTVPAEKTIRLQFRGDGVASGLYLIRVQGETFSTVRRATLVR